jgi:hypothetical protein
MRPMILLGLVVLFAISACASAPKARERTSGTATFAGRR